MSETDERPGALRERDVRRRFDRAAATFDQVDFVHRRAADGLFERMSPMLLSPLRILDAGAATGKASRELAQRFRKSHVISLDRSMNMLRRAKKSRSRFTRVSELQADAAKLPFRSGSFDLVFANMLLPWIEDLPVLFSEIDRVLRRDGLLVFSSLGPDSLREVREAWSAMDEREHVNTFIDMHDVGDELMRAGLREPVLDVDYLTVTYRNSAALFDDLTLAGARNSLKRRPPGLTGRRRLRQVQNSLDSIGAGKPLPLCLELVFGHAWGGGGGRSSGEYRIDVGQIGRRPR